MGGYLIEVAICKGVVGMVQGARKPCLDCQRLTTNGSRCRLCTGKRGSSTKRGYGAAHQRVRKGLVDSGATHCATCGKPFTTDNPMTAGHVRALRHRGSGDASNYIPECRRCNYGWNRK